MPDNIQLWRQRATLQIEKPAGIESTVNFPFMITSAILPDGILDITKSTAQNGGGDLRFTSDPYGKVDLPCEIVFFVQSKIPSKRKAQIWVLLSAWEFKTISHIYLWWGTEEEMSQPIPSDIYGKYAVWDGINPYRDFVYHITSIGDLNSSARPLSNLVFERKHDTGSLDPVNTFGFNSDSLAINLERDGKQYLESAQRLLLAPGRSVQASFWFKGNTSANGGLLHFGDDNSGNPFQRFALKAFNKEYIFTFGSVSWETGLQFTVGEWEHIVMTYDGDTQIEFYHNGIRYDTGFQLSQPLIIDYDYVYIGKQLPVGGSKYIDGDVAELRISVDSDLYNESYIANLYTQMKNPEIYGTKFWNDRSFPIVSNYCERNNLRLIEQFKNKPNLLGLLCAYTKQLQELEFVFDDLYLNRWLDTAIGLQLDHIGEIVGLSRQDLSDDEYRDALRFQIIVNAGNGEWETLIAVAKSLTKTEEVRIWSSYPAGVVLLTNGVTIPINLVQLIEQSAVGGVKVEVSCTYGQTNQFEYAEGVGEIDSTSGYSEPGEPGTGGVYSEKIL